MIPPAFTRRRRHGIAVSGHLAFRLAHSLRFQPAGMPDCRWGGDAPPCRGTPPDPAPFQCGLPPGDTDEHVITGGAFKVEDAAGEAAADAACDGETERASSRLMRPELTAGCEPLGPVARSG
jgi:hypothetical protein